LDLNNAELGIQLLRRREISLQAGSPRCAACSHRRVAGPQARFLQTVIVACAAACQHTFLRVGRKAQLPHGFGLREHNANEIQKRSGFGLASPIRGNK
jgi:hypothetical protein